jgi:hypothetical protein
VISDFFKEPMAKIVHGDLDAAHAECAVRLTSTSQTPSRSQEAGHLEKGAAPELGVPADIQIRAAKCLYGHV